MSQNDQTFLISCFNSMPTLSESQVIKRNIPHKLIKKTAAWLKPKGIKYFKNIKKKHGCINAVWMESGIPHPVHFREGMQVRNFMRMSKLCKDWTDHDYDNNWIDLIEKAIS